MCHAAPMQSREATRRPPKAPALAGANLPRKFCRVFQRCSPFTLQKGPIAGAKGSHSRRIVRGNPWFRLDRWLGPLTGAGTRCRMLLGRRRSGGRTKMAYVESTSDERTVNNTMRHQYRVLSDAERANMAAIKDQGLAFHNFVAGLGNSRELSLAKTKIEEAVMWAVKHITA